MAGMRLIAAIAFAAAATACERAPEQAAAATATAAGAGAAAESGGIRRWAHEDSDILPDPAVRYGTLPNGFRYALMPNATPPGQASLRLLIDAGSLVEEPDQRGLAHLLEHMAFNGSEHFPEGEAPKALQRLGMSLGADANASTGTTQTTFMLNVREVSDEALDTAFLFLGDVADGLALDPAAVDRERGVVDAERRRANPVGTARSEILSGLQYPGHRLADSSPIGDPDVVAHAPAERVRAFYETWYRPDNATLVFVGDADIDAVEPRVRATFGGWARPESPLARPDLGPIAADRPPTAAVLVDPNAVDEVVFSVVGPAYGGPDDWDTRGRFTIRNTVANLVNVRLRRVQSAVDTPLSGASASPRQNVHGGAASSITLGARARTPGGWREALTVLEQEHRRLLEHGFTEAELVQVLAGMGASLKAQADSAGTRPSLVLANDLAARISANQVFGHPRTYLERFEERRGAVTLERVDAQLREDWGASGPLIFVSSSQPIEGGADAVLAAFAASRAVPVDPPVDNGVQEFAYTDFGPPGAVRSRAEVEDLGFTEVVFANGVRLNVKHTDVTKDQALVRVRFGRGRMDFAGAPNAGALQSSSVNALISGGLAAHSSADLAAVLAGRNVAAGPAAGVSDDRASLSVGTRRESLLLQLQVLAAYFTAPGFRPEGLAGFHRTVEAAYDRQDDTPSGALGRFVPSLIRGGGRLWSEATKEEMLAPTVDDARAALAKPLAESYLEMAIVGDVDVDAVIAAVAQTFGALPPRAEAPEPFDETLAPRFPAPTPEPVALEHDGAASQAALAVYWPTTDDSDSEIDLALQLASRALGDKLRERAREEMGASYAPRVGSTMTSHPGYGYISAGLDASPAAVEAAFAAIDEAAAALAAGDFDADAFQRARKPLEEALDQIDAGAPNAFWSNMLADAQAEPEGLDEYRRARAELEAVTREDVIAAAAKYLDPSKAYRVVALPKPGAPPGGEGPPAGPGAPLPPG